MDKIKKIATYNISPISTNINQPGEFQRVPTWIADKVNQSIQPSSNLCQVIESNDCWKLMIELPGVEAKSLKFHSSSNAIKITGLKKTFTDEKLS